MTNSFQASPGRFRQDVTLESHLGRFLIDARLSHEERSQPMVPRAGHDRNSGAWVALIAGCHSVGDILAPS